MWQLEDLSRRVWRLEDQARDLPAMRQQIDEHHRRLSLLEMVRSATGSPPTMAAIREAAMIGGIGVIVGAMWATGDPAGAAMVLSKLLGAK